MEGRWVIVGRRWRAIVLVVRHGVWAWERVRVNEGRCHFQLSRSLSVVLDARTQLFGLVWFRLV